MSPTHLLVTGTVLNTGTATWQKDNLENEFRLRLRIIRRDTGDFLKELRWVFPGRDISPNQFEDFRFIIDSRDIDNNSSLIDLDVIKENHFSFVDFSLPPARFELPEARNPAELYDYKISLLSLSQKPTGIYILQGNIENRAYFDLDFSEYSSPCLRIGAKVTRPEAPDFTIWESRAVTTMISVPRKQTADFTLAVPPDLVNCNYFIEINLVAEREYWFSEAGYASEKIILSTSALPAAPLSRHSYQISPQECTIELSHNFLLRVSGVALNSGKFPLLNLHSEKTPLRMGGLIYSLDGVLIAETRSELNFQTGFLPGEQQKFTLAFNLIDVPKGTYRIVVDGVLETSFWLHQETDEEYSIEYIHNPSDAPRESATTREGFIKRKSASNIKLLFIAPHLPLYDRASGDNRMLEILRILSRECEKVVFACDSPGIHGDVRKYEERLHQINVSFYYGVLSYLSTVEPNSFDVVVLAWFTCSSTYQKAVRSILPSAKLITDSVDIHWLREERGFLAQSLTIDKSDLEARAQDEINTYKESDCIWVVTDEDKNEVSRKISQLPTYVVSNIHRVNLVEKKYSDIPTVIFVGGFRHPPNESAALWCHEIVSEYRIRFKRPLRLLIIGDSPPDSVSRLHNGDDTIVTGFVEHLEEYYGCALALLAPLRYGAGIKGKICHAICSRVPVITTSIGLEGTGLIPDKEVLLANTTDEFVEQIDRIISEKVNLSLLASSALDRILLLTGEDSVRKQIIASIQYPTITIGIVTFNKVDLLEKCLKSLFELTSYPFFNVAVVSNGCTDGTRELLKLYERNYPSSFFTFFNKENEFFVKPNNFLIKTFDQDDIVLVNNDIEFIEPSWLTNLYYAAYSSPFIGAAGGMVLDGHGMVSEAGAEILSNGYGTNIGRGLNPESEQLISSRYVGYISGCLLYMRRDAINRVGVFDEDFHPMYYEDADWQYRLHKIGIHSIYTSGCVAVHHEGSSAGTSTKSGMKRFQEINRHKFNLRHPDVVGHE